MNDEIKMVDCPTIEAYAGGASVGGVGSRITVRIDGVLIDYIPAAGVADVATNAMRGLKFNSPEWNASRALRDVAALTPCPAPSAAPHQGADALREASESLLAAVDFAHEALWAIATKQRMFGDTLEPIHNIAKASALARAAYDRLHPAFMAHAALAQHQAPQQGEQHV